MAGFRHVEFRMSNRIAMTIEFEDLILHIYKYLKRAFLLPKTSNNLLERMNVLLRV